MTKRMNPLAVIIGVALTAAGCTGGTQFVKPDASALVLRKTTEHEVRQRLGDPARSGTALRNGETVTTAAYSYALAMPYVDDVKVRAMSFFFVKGVLVGYNFTSSFDEDKTSFDDSKIPGIERGRTTRNDLIATFGQPGGWYTYPLIKDAAGTALVYFFIDSNRHPLGATVRQKTKLLVVSIDGQGVVTDVDYTTTAPR